MTPMRMGLIALLCLTLLACAGWGRKKEPELGSKEEAAQLFARGEKYMKKEDWELAIDTFERLESRYPFGEYAQKAQLEIAYAHYKLGEPDAAIAAAEEFIKLNPLHKEVDYAYYIKGLANFHRYEGLLDRFIPKDYAALDPEPYQQAFNDFKLLVKRFPDSKYAPDARQRLIYLRNLLARHELLVAEHYEARRAWVAMANRCAYIVQHYEGADIVPDALAKLIKAYRKMGLDEPASEARRVLELNFPERAAALRR